MGSYQIDGKAIKTRLVLVSWFCSFVCLFVRFVLEYSGNRNSDFQNVVLGVSKLLPYSGTS